MELLSAFCDVGMWVSHKPADWLRVVLHDPDDDHFLWTAEQGHAEYLISIDRHLCSLRSHKGIPIGTPRDFFE